MRGCGFDSRTWHYSRVVELATQSAVNRKIRGSTPRMAATRDEIARELSEKIDPVFWVLTNSDPEYLADVLIAMMPPVDFTRLMQIGKEEKSGEETSSS